ncbi:MAG: TolC family outer membrane protein [Magnetococcales bacterium]|nr:TolC family outer membrane protein [Magnetococcales bacterium]
MSDCPRRCIRGGVLWLLTSLLMTGTGWTEGKDYFREVAGRTLAVNPKVVASQARLDVAMKRQDQAEAALRPNMTFQGQANQLRTEWDGGVQKTHPDSVEVALTQVLFNRKALVGLEQIAPVIDAARQEYEGACQSVLYELGEAAIGLLEAVEVAALARSNQEVTGKHLEATKARFEVGELPRTDVSRAEARLASARADRLKAENEQAIRRAKFREVAGEEAALPFRLPPWKHAVLEQSLEALSAAVESRPDVKAAVAQLDVARLEVELSRSDHYPVLTLNGSRSRTWNLGSQSTPGTLDKTSLGLGVSVPLYSGGLTMAQVDQEQARFRAAQADLDRVRQQALREIEQAFHQYRNAMVVVDSLVAGERAARDAADGVAQEFKVGTRTSLDVLDAQHELFTAATDLTRGRYNVLVSSLQLLRASGVLTPGILTVDENQ